MPNNIIESNDLDFAQTVLGTSGVVLVDFSATWCGPCKAQTPILDRWAGDHPDVKVVGVDVDHSPQTAASCGIRSVPTLAVFIDGKPITSAAGVHNARRLDALVEHSKSHAA